MIDTVFKCNFSLYFGGFLKNLNTREVIGNLTHVFVCPELEYQIKTKDWQKNRQSSTICDANIHK